MPRYLTLEPHLTPAALEQRYRRSHDPVERSHWHMLWLLGSGHRIPVVAMMTGYSAKWIRTVLHRYNADGPDGVGDRRHTNPGQPPLLGPALREELRQALGGPAPDGGLWTGRKVAGWMAQRLGRPIGEVRGWDAMVTLGFSPQRPRPRATTADPEAQVAFKRGGSSAPSMR